uniref:PUM-HD domain-containing protein n=1 Tax=Oryza punctata TaxID=4537 RepID=A0A0E0LWY4_ORYPU
MCRDRRDFIKQALEQRNRFASSHFAYIESLRRVSMALQRFVAGDDHHELIFDPFISPLKQHKPELLGLPYGSYEKRAIHVSKYLRSGPNPSVSVEEQPRPVETIRIESHYPTDNYGSMDRFFAAQPSPMRPSSYYPPPYDRPNYPLPSPQEPVRNSYYMPYDRPSYPPASPQEPTRTSYYASYDRPSYPPPSPQEQESSQWDFFWNPFSSLDSFSYPRPRSSYDNVVTDDELARLQRCEPRNKVELEIKAHKKELMRNKVANAEETPGFTVYLNRRPASLAEAMKDIDSQFLGICDAAKEISVMLEASRAQYSTSNDLSAKMLNPVSLLRSVSSRSSSSRFLLAPTSSIEDLYDNETNSCYSEESCSTMSGSHHSTLDRLYTWEKKLYKEVKAGERLRIDYEKRLNHLRNQDVKGDEPSSVDKTRATLRSLHTRMKVSIHTVQSISGRIEVLRDEEMQPQLMELIQGLSRMWRAMAERHKAQKRTIDDAKLLFLQRHHTAATAIALSAPDAGTPPPAAVALECEIRAWRGALETWLSAQRAYARALAAWARRCLGIGGVSGGALPHAASLPLAFAVCMEWGHVVDAASEARVMDGLDFFVAGVGSVCSGVATGMEGMAGRVLCAGMAAVTGAMAEFADASADGYDALVSAVAAGAPGRRKEESLAQPTCGPQTTGLILLLLPPSGARPTANRHGLALGFSSSWGGVGIVGRRAGSEEIAGGSGGRNRESAVRLIGGTGAGNWSKDFGAFDSSLGSLSGEGLGFVDNNSGVYGGWRESVPNRSGSAPPSMEGSLAALGHMIGQQSGNLEATLGGKLGNVVDSSKSEEQLRADPAYCDYYGSKVNLNPRLPPPLMSRESRRFMNRVGKVKEWRVVSQDDSNKGSLFIPRSTLSTHREEPEDDRSPRLDSSSAEDAQGSGKSGSNFDSHYTCMNLGDFASESFQQKTASLYDSSSHPSNSNTGDGISDHSDINSSTDFSLDAVKTSGLNSWTPVPVTSTVRSTHGNSISSTSVPSSSCPDNNPSMQTSQQEKPSVDIKLGNDVPGSGSILTELDTVNSNMKNLRISLDNHDTIHIKQQWQDNVLQQYGPSPSVQGDPIQMIPQGTHLPHVPFVDNLSHTQLKLPTGDMQQFLPPPGMTTPFYAPNSFGSPYYQNLHPASVLPTPFGTAGYAFSGSALPPVMTSYAPQVSAATPVDNPITPSFSGRPSGFPSPGNLSAGAEFVQPYKMYGQQLGVTMQPSVPDPNLFQFFQHPSLLSYAGINQYNTMGPRVSVVGNPADSFDPQKVLPQPTYPSDQRLQLPRTGIYNSPAAKRGGTTPNYQGMAPYVGAPMTYPTSPVFQGQPFTGVFSPGRRNDSVRFQTPPSRNMTTYSGIQGQREREKFDDPKACSFLEELKSNRARRVELSDIAGRIVEYSADQHGSRFIQQKLENCTAEEKASVFAEVLPHASSLMTDVFGNYVIQKFFEHGTPEQRRDLATKLVGHVLPLSLQMYGCRVIQKALEVMELDQKIDLVRELDGNIMRCQCIIDEILESACVLAQDQYGNYVTQHVLERGRGQERTQIISKLAGQVVTMSQNKFASNVIEKCFQHGDMTERDLLIREIVKQTEGNDNLLAMMKDQYANYVVQKILETCNEQQRELLLSRVKGHLQALRKYTYGKHIVSRVEQLCGEGETESDS